jgi:hypothetical protein
MLGAVHEQLRRVEERLGPEPTEAKVIEAPDQPGWQRAGMGEPRLPPAIAVALAIVLELILPSRFTIRPFWVLPALEGALLIGLIIVNPTRINRTSTLVRAASILLIALISLTNAYSSAELIHAIINGTAGDRPELLLIRGANVYVTNIIVFALWYWEWDRGGPVARAQGLRPYPDFLFPQMGQGGAGMTPPDWRPNFLDYLYVSYTNVTAFSPTDTMPMSRWAKMLMLLQSAIALLTVAFVIARAVNVLK